MYPQHDDQMVRLNKIEGQIRGIKKMIQENRYCVDIIHQCSSVTAALTEVKKNILRKHLNHCVMNALHSNEPFDSDRKIEEIVALMDHMSK